MKKKAIIVTALCVVLSMSIPASAKTSSDKDNTIDVNATISRTLIDCTVTQSIYARATGADPDDPLKLSYDSLTIANNMKAGKLKVTSIKATGNNPWVVVADSDKTWKDLATDSHLISIQASCGDTIKDADLAGNGVTKQVEIKNGSSVSYSFSGHTGAVSAAISESENLTVATIVATVALC